jgi:class 3 adenylate cyclase
VTSRQPQTHYVEVGGADVAYQVIGEGPPDLLLFNAPATHIEMNWTLPDYAEVFTRLASFSRLIMFDRRGAGASNEAPPNMTWEDCVEDAVAVLDAVGSKKAAVVSVAESVPLTLLFAATYPSRVASLVLIGGFARARIADDYPIGQTQEEWDATQTWVAETWGTTDLIRAANPSKVHDEQFLERGAAMVRASMSPRRFALYMKQIALVDVRHVLPLISVPTLVLHPKDYEFIPPAMGRYLAEHIAGARFVELPGADYGLMGEASTAITDEITEFLTGRRPAEVERLLSTILFTDIVDSTAIAASVGDRQWHSMLDAHDRVVREQLERFRGREVNTTGDGFIASFDGPARAIRCAQAIHDATEGVGIKLRAGLHTGECEVRGDDLGGLAVHIAARVGTLAAPAETLLSGTVKDLVVGSGIEFTDRGEHELKGVPGAWKLYAVTHA